MADEPRTDELAKRRSRKGRHQSGNPISGKRQIELTQKQADALQLRLGGASLKQIADALGYSQPSGAHYAIMQALKVTLPEQTREQHRNIELARLDRLMLAHWTPALAGDDKSARVVLQCVGMRAKLLGLEAPAQVNVNLYEGDAVEISVLQLLSDEQLEAALKMRNEVMELSRLRAGAIDAESS